MDPERRVRRSTARTHADKPPPVPDKTRGHARPLLLAEHKKRIPVPSNHHPGPAASTSSLAEHPQRKSSRLLPPTAHKDSIAVPRDTTPRSREPPVSRRREAAVLEPAGDISRLKQELEILKQTAHDQKKLLRKQSKTIEEFEKTTREKDAQMQDFKFRIKQSDGLISSIEGSLHCQICMDLLDSPFLSSCGHIFCLGCLQSWFRQAPAAEDDMIVESDLVHRVKKCPCCRSEITTRPIPVFLIKSLVKTITEAKAPATRSAVEPPASPQNQDVWAGLFHRPGEVCRYYNDSEDNDDEEEEGYEDEDGDGRDSDDSMAESSVPDPDEFEYGSDGDEDEFMGDWIAPAWEPPHVWLPSDMEDMYEAEEFSMLRRGATSEMIDQFGMTYTHARGLSTYVVGGANESDMMVYLGWNVMLKDEDLDGVEFMDWARMDMDEHPNRWRIDLNALPGVRTITRLVREDQVGAYDSTDTDA